MSHNIREITVGAYTDKTQIEISVYSDYTPVAMIMYGKEIRKRKQEIDRQHHTIPNQRTKDKNCRKIYTFGFPQSVDYYENHILTCYSYKLFQNSYYDCDTVGTKV